MHLSLEPTPAQTIALQETMEAVNATRNQISALAWERSAFTARALFEAYAEDIGTELGLSLAMARRCIANVAASYRVQRRVQQRYRPLQSIPYDRNTLRIATQGQAVTLWTVIGWQAIGFVSHTPLPENWSLPVLMQVRGRWALLLLVVPDREGE